MNDGSDGGGVEWSIDSYKCLFGGRYDKIKGIWLINGHDGAVRG